MELFELTKKLIGIESISGHEGEIVRYLKGYLESCGFTVHLQTVSDDRCNLFAWAAVPKIVLSTHMDTVSPFFAPDEDKKYIYGRGACDAKGIMACQIKTVEQLISRGCTDVGLLFVVGEESGSDGAVAANAIPNDCRYIINGEPTENTLAAGTKGSIRMRLKASGKAAHSAYPELGDSAILKLIGLLSMLYEQEWPDHELLGKTTCNVGTIRGGTQANVIPDHAEAELIFRTVTDFQKMKDLIENVVQKRARIEYICTISPAFLTTLETFETSVVSYTTDIPLLSNWGKPLLLGPGSIHEAHTPGERVPKKDLMHAVALYDKIVSQLLSR